MALLERSFRAVLKTPQEEGAELQAQVAALQAQIDLFSAAVPGLGVPGASVLAGLLVGFVLLERRLGRRDRRKPARSEL